MATTWEEGKEQKLLEESDTRNGDFLIIPFYMRAG